MDFKSTLTDALKQLGCDSSQFDFDDRSTIALRFADVGELYLDPVDGQIWMWGSLPELPQSTLRTVAYELLTVLAEPTPYLAGEGLTLRADEDRWRVGGLLRSDCMYDTTLLAGAVEGFYLRLTALYEAAK